MPFLNASSLFKHMSAHYWRNYDMKKSNSMIAPLFLLPLFFLFVTLSGNAFSQTKENEENSNCPLHEGSWALQFQVGENFSLSAFEGFGISTKRHYSDNSAVRYGVFLNGSIEKTDFGYSGSRTDNQNLEMESVNLTAVYLYYPNPENIIKFFYGAGPSITYSHRKNIYEQKLNGELVRTLERDETRSNQFGVGLQCVLGVEWFFSRNLSLHAEYSMDMEYGNEKTETTSLTEGASLNETTTNKDYFHLNQGGVTLGLSIYL